MSRSHPPVTAKRICIYIRESDRWHAQALHAALLSLLKEEGMAEVVLLRGMAGVAAHSRLQSTTLEALAMDLPLRIEAVDRPEKIEAVLEKITPMVREGMITLEEVQIIKFPQPTLNPLPVDRLVSACMTKEVVAFFHNQTVGHAWKRMLVHNIKAAPVVNAQGQVVGIITDQDLLDRAGVQRRLSIAVQMSEEIIRQELNELDKSPIRLADVMSKPVVTIPADEHLGKAVSIMTRLNLKRLPVVNQENELVGILSRLDVLRQVMDWDGQETSPSRPAYKVKTVGEIMRPNLPTVGLAADVAEIIQTMTALSSHRVIVLDDQGRPAGLISHSDLFTRVHPQKHAGILSAFRKQGKAPQGKECAADLMSPNPLWAPPDLSILDAVRRMLQASRKWLVVIDENQQPLGWVDRQTLLIALSPDAAAQG